MKQEIGAAIVVTYNRKEKLEYCLKCLLEQSYPLQKIYVVNNASTDNTELFLEDISKLEERISYRTMKENLGGAGGFSEAIKWAFDDGVDWIWGMDDDAFPQKEALENLLEERKKLGNQHAYWSNPDQDNQFNTNTKQINEWMFVGFFLPRNIYEAIGLPRGDFFIYYDDFEYADRMIKHGYSIYKIRNSDIDHQTLICEAKYLKLGNKKVAITMLPTQSWKLYYLVRNDMLRFERKDKRRTKAFLRNVRRLLKVVCYQPSHLGIYFKALWHGCIGKSGKTVEP